MDCSAESSTIRRSNSEDEVEGYNNTEKTQPPSEIDGDGVILNDDCLSKIFGYLDIFDLVNVAASCTHLKSLARDVFGRTFAKDVVTVSNQSNTRGHKTSVSLLAHFGDLITKLRVDYINPDSVEHELEDAISEYCRKSLIEVEFKDCSDFAFNRIERPYKAVQKVLFTGCQNGSWILKFNELFPKARSLDVTCTSPFTYSIEQSFPQLDHLGFVQSHYSIDNAMRCEVTSIMAAINLNPQLKSLTLKFDDTYITSDELSYINEKLPLLETLNIAIVSISLKKKKQIHFQNLQKLTIVFDESFPLEFRITTRLPVDLTLIGEWLNTGLSKFFSTNRNWMRISLHGFWWSYNDFEKFKEEITTQKLLTSIEMSVNGLKGKENEVLSVLDQCKSLRKFKVYSGHFFGPLLKFCKAIGYSGNEAELARSFAAFYGSMIHDPHSDDTTFLEVYRREFELKFRNSAWLPKYEAKKKVEGDYCWTKFSVEYEKKNSNDQ